MENISQSLASHTLGPNVERYHKAHNEYNSNPTHHKRTAKILQTDTLSRSSDGKIEERIKVKTDEVEDRTSTTDVSVFDNASAYATLPAKNFEEKNSIIGKFSF